MHPYLPLLVVDPTIAVEDIAPPMFVLLYSFEYGYCVLAPDSIGDQIGRNSVPVFLAVSNESLPMHVVWV